MSEAALAAPTFRYLESTQTMLVQDDCTDSETAPPPELLALGVRAQVLAPILRGGHVYGIIAVHHNGSARQWTTEDLDAIHQAVRRVDSIVGATGADGLY